MLKHRLVILAALIMDFSLASGGEMVWFEGEEAVESSFSNNTWFKPQNEQERAKLSGGAWLNTDKTPGATAKWIVEVPKAGEYAFWTRKFWHHGPFQWRWNDQEWARCGKDCALADGVELRKFVCANWVFLAKVTLPAGKNTLMIRLEDDGGAACFDCFLLIQGTFTPDGANKPGQRYNRVEPGWFAWEPDMDEFRAEALLDLRHLNQKVAGEEGFVQAKGLDFVFSQSGRRVKFWAVNCSPETDTDEAARFMARRLAKLGVNLVRIHSGVWDRAAADPTAVDSKRLNQIHRFVAALTKEGIYTKLSFYFPVWFEVRDNFGLPGYKPGEKPFAALFFLPRMQEIYRAWAKGLLTTKNPYTGKSLAADQAVAIVEIINEDNLFFWPFSPGSIPRPAMEVLEKAFGDWLIKKYGTLAKAREAWGDDKYPHTIEMYTKLGMGPDDWEKGLVRLYGAAHMGGADWAVAQRNPKRISDQVRFLTEYQRSFYQTMAEYFRKELGVKCAISASNWTTVDNRVLGALDKYTNLACDVIDRHGYFSGLQGSEDGTSGYAIEVGHWYLDRSGLKEPNSLTPEIQYLSRPHIISEYGYPQPNRFVAESVFLAATYGALGGTDAIFHFAAGIGDWERAHGKFSIYTPAVMGQFPAAALVFRQGMVREGPVVLHSAVSLADLYELKGTPMAQPQNLDALRQADIPPGKEKAMPGAVAVDPLAFYVGQVTMEISETPGESRLTNLEPFIDRANKIVKSATGELAWDWSRGVIKMNSPSAQGACGFLKDAGEITLHDMSIAFGQEYGAVMAVALDGQTLAKSDKILLQVMTEARNYGWKTALKTFTPKGAKEAITALVIEDKGAPPIIVREIAGVISFRMPDAAKRKVIALDSNGYARQMLGRGADRIELLRDCIWYIVSR